MTGPYRHQVSAVRQFGTMLAIVALLATMPLLAQEIDFGPPVELIIEGGEERHRFTVEIADEPQERARGLMFREEMARDAGMLFVFDRPRLIGMWMKNTPLPLDMLFADRAGRIVGIHENAIPFSTDVISAPRRALYVLELNAGVVHERGIAVGDRLLVEAIRQ